MPSAFRVDYSPTADRHLSEIESYIAREASPAIAMRYIDQIVKRCDSLAVFPRRGTPRDDLRPGLRTIAFRRRVTIAYLVEAERVVIVAIRYAGREIAELLPD